MYKIKEIKKPEYIEIFRTQYGFIPSPGRILTDEEKKMIYEFERKNSNTVFATLEKVGEK